MKADFVHTPSHPCKRKLFDARAALVSNMYEAMHVSALLSSAMSTMNVSLDVGLSTFHLLRDIML